MLRPVFVTFGMILAAWSSGCQAVTRGGGGAPGGSANADDTPDTGILISTPAGAEGQIYDLFTADGSTLISQGHDTGEIEEVDPGTYLITEYFNEGFVFARDVTVTAGQVTTVPFGGILVTTTADSEGEIYDLYDATGTMLLSRASDSDEIVSVPPGTYTLKGYFAEFVIANDIIVIAGEAVTFAMGSIRYEGAESNYDIYDETGTMVLIQPAAQNESQPMPPGTYVLKDYFGEMILAEGVVVTAGQTTVVP